jgi:MFS transporter, YNFM family, putative membrane transport protein
MPAVAAATAAATDPGHRRVLIALVAIGMTTFVQLYYPQALIPAILRRLHYPLREATSVSNAFFSAPVVGFGSRTALRASSI